MNNIGLLILLVAVFAAGAAVGEAYAPFSGNTSHALSARCAGLEERIAALETRCARLEEAAKAWATWLVPHAGAPAWVPADDGGMRIMGSEIRITPTK